MARGTNRRRVDSVPGERRRRIARAAALFGAPIAAVAALGGAAFLAWRAGLDRDLLPIREIRYEGISRATADELTEISPAHVGDRLLTCDTDAVEAALRRHPWVASVEVRRRLPSSLEVRIVERRAAALVDLGGLYLADERGEVFKRAMPGDGLDLPLVTGISREDWIERQGEVEPTLAGALALVDRWAERGLDRRLPVSEVHIDPEYGTTLFAGDGGLEVRLGHGGISEKLARLERVLAALDAEGRRAEVLHLDNRRRPDWVAVRLAARRGDKGGRPAGQAGARKAADSAASKGSPVAGGRGAPARQERQDGPRGP